MSGQVPRLFQSPRIIRFGFTPVGSGGPTATLIDAGSSISGGYFSKKKWHALIGQLAKEAHERADRARRKKEREILAKSAEMALEAAVHAEKEAAQAKLERIEQSLRLAVNAKTLRETFEASAAVRKHVADLRKQMEDDDEEEAIELLLLH